MQSLFETLDSFNVTMELDSNEAIKSLVQKNCGVSILSERSCKKEVESQQLVLLPIENKRMMREVSLVCLKDSVQVDTLKELKKVYDRNLKQKHKVVANKYRAAD